MRVVLAVAGVSLLVPFLAACAEWGALTNDELVPQSTMNRAKTEASTKPASYQQRLDFGFLTEFAGRTFHGEPTGDVEGAVADVQRWEWSQDGTALIIRHRLVDGSYGGNSTVTKNAETGKLSYIYNTNAGFSTQGDFTINKDMSWVSVEEVSGASGITKVRSRGHVRDDGALISISEFLKNGEWVPGHGFIYREVWQDLPELETPVQE